MADETTRRSATTKNIRPFFNVSRKFNWAIMAPDKSMASGVFMSAMEFMANAIFSGIFN